MHIFWCDAMLDDCRIAVAGVAARKLEQELLQDLGHFTLSLGLHRRAQARRACDNAQHGPAAAKCLRSAKFCDRLGGRQGVPPVFMLRGLQSGRSGGEWQIKNKSDSS